VGETKSRCVIKNQSFLLQLSERVVGMSHHMERVWPGPRKAGPPVSRAGLTAGVKVKYEFS